MESTWSAQQFFLTSYQLISFYWHHFIYWRTQHLRCIPNPSDTWYGCPASLQGPQSMAGVQLAESPIPLWAEFHQPHWQAPHAAFSSQFQDLQWCRQNGKYVLNWKYSQFKIFDTSKDDFKMIFLQFKKFIKKKSECLIFFVSEALVSLEWQIEKYCSR